MKINESTLGLDCEVTIRRKDSRDDEVVTRHTFFGLDNTKETALLIADLARKELIEAGKNPDDYYIHVN